MRCSRVPSGHWVGVLTLLFGLCMMAGGVLSPWWRVVEEHSCCRYEGLWQQCHRCWDSTTRCRFSERNTGVWRAIQTMHLLSLLCLTGGLLCSLICVDKRRCTQGNCPTSSLAAVTGGAVGLLGDLMFVGYVERYVQHSPREHVYAWSFAMAVAGSLLSVLASLIFSISKSVCLPRYSSQAAEPYWPYNHYRIGLDPSGCPHYYPYPCPYSVVHGGPPAELNLCVVPSASEKRILFEQYRDGRVQTHTEEEKVPTNEAWPPYSGTLPADVKKGDNNNNNRIFL